MHRFALVHSAGPVPGARSFVLSWAGWHNGWERVEVGQYRGGFGWERAKEVSSGGQSGMGVDGTGLGDLG